MKYTVLNLPWLMESECFDTQSLEALQTTDTIVSLSEHFFNHGGRPQWTLMVSHRPLESSRTKPGVRRQRNKRETPEELGPAQHSRYEALRLFRNQRAIDLGRPPYAVMTNAQLRQVATLEEPSVTSLKTIKGIGDAKVAEFGADMLAVLAAVQPVTEASDDDV